MRTIRTNMPVSQRAKQFLPFAALSGLNEALAAKEKELTARRELSSESASELNEKLMKLRRSNRIRVLRYANGEYTPLYTSFLQLCAEFSYIETTDGKIAFEDLYDIEIYNF